MEDKQPIVKYFPIAYMKSECAFIGHPCDTQEEALDFLRQIMAVKAGRVIVATTVIKRDLSQMKDPKFIFGHPKSLDLKQGK